MNLALFDFDGTITTTDTFTPFLRYSAHPARLVAGAVVLSPVMVGHRLGVLTSRSSRPLVSRFAFSGRDAVMLRAAGAEYAATFLQRVTRPQALERIAWHKVRGDKVVVVSASLDVYLAHWCRALGVEVICTELEERKGRMTGRYVDGDCSGAEKLRRIRGRYDVASYARIYAYGDTDEDCEMLSLAHERYFRWTRVVV